MTRAHSAPAHRRGLELCFVLVFLWMLVMLAPAARATDQIVNPIDGTVLVKIPGGPFIMGSEDYADEIPPHSLTLEPYYIAKIPVTNEQFARFVTATGHVAAGDWKKYSALWGEHAPVVNVSWHDARAYCAWAGLRLPTEAEWEKAARGTDGRKFPWGNDWDPDRCCNSVGKVAPGAAVVGSYPSGASPYGCLDMVGSVDQWCSSLYRPYPYRADDGRESADGNGARAMRGGSWHSHFPQVYRCSFHNSAAPNVVDKDLGFRCARSLTVEPAR